MFISTSITFLLSKTFSLSLAKNYLYLELEISTDGLIDNNLD